MMTHGWREVPTASVKVTSSAGAMAEKGLRVGVLAPWVVGSVARCSFLTSGRYF